MSVSQSVAGILRERVTLEVESIDRLYLNVYVPKLQRVGGRGRLLSRGARSDLRLLGADGTNSTVVI